MQLSEHFEAIFIKKNNNGSQFRHENAASLEIIY